MRRKYKIGNRKVAIVGAGFVGSSIAYALTLRDVAREIVLIDIDHGKTAGEAKDIRHGLVSMGTVGLYAGDYRDCADCDLIIITAGRSRKPGESRLDLVNDNIKIMKGVITSIQKYYTRGVILIISNPLDILTYKAAQWMELPNGMVFGSGCILDSSRFVTCIADYLEISTGVISGYIVGEHGDSQVPVWSHVSVGGIPIDDFCAESKIAWNDEIKKRIADQTKTMAGEIIAGKGRTNYGIATYACQLADAIINMKPTIASVSSVLMGEHGFKGVALSVPSVIGPAGVQLRIKERWEAEEFRGFSASVEKIRETMKLINE